MFFTPELNYTHNKLKVQVYHMKAGKLSESVLKRSVLKTIKYKSDDMYTFANVGMMQQFLKMELLCHHVWQV